MKTKLIVMALLVAASSSSFAGEWAVVRDGKRGQARITEKWGGKAISDFMPLGAHPEKVVAEHNATEQHYRAVENTAEQLRQGVNYFIHTGKGKEQLQPLSEALWGALNP